MQKPHCSACCSWNACWSGCSSSRSAQRLDGAHRPPVGLHREHQARAHGLAVDLHRARSADAVLAADVRAGQPEVVAQEVGQQRARLDVRRRAVAPLTSTLILTRRPPRARAARATSSAPLATGRSTSAPASARGLARAGAPSTSAASAALRAHRRRGRAEQRDRRACRGATTTAAPAIAQSPCVRACSTNAGPRPRSGSARDLDLDEQLVGAQRRGQVRDEELARAGTARARRASAGGSARPARSARPASRRSGRRARTSRRSCRASGSADGRRAARPAAAAASRGRPGRSARASRAASSRRCAAAALAAQVREAVDAVDVDELRRPREAEVHDRHERLAAGEHLRVVVEQRERRLDGPRRLVVERRGLHERASSGPRRRIRRRRRVMTAGPTAGRRAPRTAPNVKIPMRSAIAPRTAPHVERVVGPTPRPRRPLAGQLLLQPPGELAEDRARDVLHQRRARAAPGAR